MEAWRSSCLRRLAYVGIYWGYPKPGRLASSSDRRTEAQERQEHLLRLPSKARAEAASAFCLWSFTPCQGPGAAE